MSDVMRFTILGCGSSPGVPRIHGDWGQCDHNEPKNRRLRCSFLIERISDEGRTTVVVDTSPDFRQQMLNAEVKSLDSVLFTHPHADHVHGIDDLRGFALAQRERITIYADEQTQKRLDQGFGYCFKQPEGSMYPPILNAYELEAGRPVMITGKGGNIHALPVLQIHGPIHSLGFRFSPDGNFDVGGLCYSPDISDVPTESAAHLKNLDCWILDALQYKPHISHFSVDEALQKIAEFKPKRAVFTHMHIPLDYAQLKSQLPAHVEPGFDGMTIELEIGEQNT
ncbi:MAG: MBL fold metallo-hydrolase [Pseudomonadota bacterium]